MRLACPPLSGADLSVSFETIGGTGWRALEGKRLFMTGGTGFVGKWMLAALIEADQRLGLGCSVTVLTRDPNAFVGAAPQLATSPLVELVRGDVRDFAFPAGRFDIVIHAATDVVAPSSAMATFATCLDGTRRVLDFTHTSGAQNFLLVSSGAVYGRQPADLGRVPEHYSGAPDALQPASAYGQGKRVAEWLACASAVDSALSVKIARCFSFVGPYLPLDKHFAIGNFMRAALAGEAIVVNGDGSPCRSYLHAADMAGWLWAVLLRGRSNTAYNVGGEEAVSIVDLAQRVADVLESTGGVHAPNAVPNLPEAQRYVPDLTRARADLGLPAPLPLDEALRRTARWHRENPGAE